MDWQRVKNGSRPQPYQKVLLHCPQWAMTLGEVITGVWTDGEWQADDDRDLTDCPPVHWAAFEWPDFEGDPDEWPDEPEFEDA